MTESEWRDLYTEFYPILVEYVRRRGYSDPGFADDVVMEVFLAAIKQEHLLPREDSDRKRWLYHVAHRKLVDSYRRERLSPSEVPFSSLDSVPAPKPDGADDVELLEQLHSLMSRLTPEQQNLLLLRYYEGWGAYEIADRLRMSRGRIYSRLDKLKRHLQQQLGVTPDIPVPPPPPTRPPIGPAARLDPEVPIHSPPTPLAQSQAAFRADLPGLLERHRGDWVAYADGKQVRLGRSQTELYKYCLTDLGLTHDRFVVRRVAPELDPQIEHSQR